MEIGANNEEKKLGWQAKIKINQASDNSHKLGIIRRKKKQLKFKIRRNTNSNVSLGKKKKFLIQNHHARQKQKILIYSFMV